MKKVLTVIMVLVLAVFMTTSVYADKPTGIYNPNAVNGTLKSKLKDVWATISVLVQIGAVGCVVFAGLRYMFAAPSQKADIKQGLIYLTIGATLVFGATLIINVVTNAGEAIM